MKYQIDRIEIDLPDGHTLPQYQQQYRLYDRFLPHLAKYLSGDVIDIGANVGATMAAMACANPQLEFLCVESSPATYVALQQNKKIVEEKLSVKVRIARAEIGSQKTTMDALIAEFDYKPDLIKVDVDGFDYDVLNSFNFEQKPMLFFEADYRSPDALMSYVKCVEKLVEKNYQYFYLFDNFGEFVCKFDIQKIEVLVELFSYIWRMKTGHSHTTIYYFDILAVTEKDLDRAEQAVQSYL